MFENNYDKFIKHIPKTDPEISVLVQSKQQPKGAFSDEEISALETDWNDLLKLNLWLKSKIDNSFYYNAILNYWQGRKKILNY